MCTCHLTEVSRSLIMHYEALGWIVRGFCSPLCLLGWLEWKRGLMVGLIDCRTCIIGGEDMFIPSVKLWKVIL
jgi:hypothetical protein